jgi:hypothetical protein
MRYATHNDIDISLDLTVLQGEVSAGYSLLCKLFGQPCSLEGYKTDAEWLVEFEDGTVASIYNWKNGMNYLGSEGTPTEQITRWNVGGHDDRALELIKALLTDPRVLTIQGHITHEPDEYEKHWDVVVAPAEVQGNPRNINENRKEVTNGN